MTDLAARQHRKDATKLWGRLTKSTRGRRMLVDAGVPYQLAIVCLDSDRALDVLKRGEIAKGEFFTLVTYTAATGQIDVSVQQQTFGREQADEMLSDGRGVFLEHDTNTMTIGRLLHVADQRRRFYKDVVTIDSREMDLIDA